jgi:hypothetical protein
MVPGVIMNTPVRTKDRGWSMYLTITATLLVLGYFLVSPESLYKSGDTIGYDIGLAGGLMLVLLLFYPLRKRASSMQNLGKLPTWFRWHMILGILGPALIILHSTFHIRSVNAAVAMTCMLLVSGSGIFGRFFYTKIHHGLYGRQATVSELKAELEGSGDIRSIFSYAPDIEKALEDFRNEAEKIAQASGHSLASLARISMLARRISRSQTAELSRALQAQVPERAPIPMQHQYSEPLFEEQREKIVAYIKAVRDASQFNIYERIFSWWHIFHIPLVYMLVFSAIYHVYAVHAY